MTDQTFYILSLNLYHIVLSFQFLKLSVQLIGVPPRSNNDLLIFGLITLLSVSLFLIFNNLGTLNCAMNAKSKKQSSKLTARAAFSGIGVLCLLMIATLLQTYVIYR